MKMNARAWIGQGLLYGLFALVIGVFSYWPRYQALPPGNAVLKVSFIHHGQRVAPCRPYTAEELAKLPPNMRTAQKCERERAPVEVEVTLDDVIVYHHVAPPAGLSRDGASTVYHRMAVPAGEHRITVRLKDAPGADFNHTRETVLRLEEAQVLVIDFDPEKGITLT
jgi:hypothetical protein